MGRIVIVAYKPKAGRSSALKTLVAGHVPRLRELGLVTDRESICMEAEDGTIVEVFEWASADAIQAAHEHEQVQHLWSEFTVLCEYIPVGETSEAAKLFSEYAAMDFDYPGQGLTA